MYHKKVIKPRHPLIADFVEYFLFFKNDKGIANTYYTYPNTNLCLAVFRQSKIFFNTPTEHIIHTTAHQYKSILTGLYDGRLTVHSSGVLDEFCIILKMDGIRRLTAMPFNELLGNEDVFQAIFGSDSRFMCEQLFDEPDFDKRGAMLENYLLGSLAPNVPAQQISYLLREMAGNSNLRLAHFAQSVNISRNKLFRDFTSNIGQSPKEYLNTIRFRKAMNLIISKKYISLTDVAYALGYFDQAHFIHGFSKYGGVSPSMFARRISVVDDVFVVGS